MTVINSSLQILCLNMIYELRIVYFSYLILIIVFYMLIFNNNNLLVA